MDQPRYSAIIAANSGVLELDADGGMRPRSAGHADVVGCADRKVAHARDGDVVIGDHEPVRLPDRVNDLSHDGHRTIAACENGRLWTWCTGSEPAQLDLGLDGRDWSPPWQGPLQAHSICPLPGNRAAVVIQFGGVLCGPLEPHDAWELVPGTELIDGCALAAGGRDGGTLALATGAGLLRRVDDTGFRPVWRDPELGYLRAVAAIPGTDRFVVSAHTNAKRDASTALFVVDVTDGSAQRCAGIPATGTGHLNELLVTPAFAVALSHHRVFVSTDGCASWEAVAPRPEYVFDPKRHVVRKLTRAPAAAA